MQEKKLKKPIQYKNIEELSKSILLAIDIETYDPRLAKEEGGLGPGVYRNDGFVLGVSIADDTGWSEYYNLGHFDCTKEERDRNIKYLQQVLALPVDKIGANISYDVDWLENWIGFKGKNFRNEGLCFRIEGFLFDVQVADFLLDENQGRYSLDFLANKYLGKGKMKTEIEAFRDYHNAEADKAHQWGGDVRKWLYKMPYEVVRSYAKADTEEPYEIFKIQKAELESKGLWNVFIMETKLLRATLSMRKEGAIIDVSKRDRNAFEIGSIRDNKLFKFEKTYGNVNLNSTQQLAKLFDSLNIEYPYKLVFIDKQGNKKEERVDSAVAKQIKSYMLNNRIQPPKGLLEATYGNFSTIVSCNASITKDWFEAMEKKLEDGDTVHDLIKDILFIRKSSKIVNDFLLGSMSANLCDDNRIHPSIHPTRTDNNGTVSGRFSMSNPNLQQIPSPSRDKFLGSKSREPFVPMANCWWVKIDYSQIEYRTLAHYASGLGSEELVNAYNQEPHTDYHQYIVDMTGLSRSYAKNLNFGGMYGMGKKKMARFFGWGMEYATEILSIYHGKAPYIKHTMDTVSRVAKSRGFIKTLSGRHAHLSNPDKAYIMVNRLIQGSAADIMKKAMVDIYESDILETLFWHITVHDELNFSVPKTAQGIREVFRARHMMEDAYKLKVPIKADMEIGENWSDVREIDFIDLNISEEEWLEGLTDANVESEVKRIIEECTKSKQK